MTLPPVESELDLFDLPRRKRVHGSSEKGILLGWCSVTARLRGGSCWYRTRLGEGWVGAVRGRTGVRARRIATGRRVVVVVGRSGGRRGWAGGDVVAAGRVRLRGVEREVIGRRGCGPVVIVVVRIVVRKIHGLSQLGTSSTGERERSGRGCISADLSIERKCAFDIR